MEYKDLNLRFARLDKMKGDHHYQVWVEGRAPGGEMLTSDAATVEFKPECFWSNTVEKTGGTLYKLEKQRLSESELFHLGQILADMAFPTGIVRDLLIRSFLELKPNQGLRLRLKIEVPELAILPWEFICLPLEKGPPKQNDFLVLRPNISLVRTSTHAQPARDTGAIKNCKFLGAFSSPISDAIKKIDVETERLQIQQIVNKCQNEANPRVLSSCLIDRPLTREKMMKNMRPGTDIFHFAGHSQFDRSVGEGVVYLETEDLEIDPFSGQQLVQLLKEARVRLAFLCSCNSGASPGENLWEGIAGEIIREQIPLVIANRFPIGDTNGVRLSQNFYSHLFAGCSVDEALYHARKAVFQNSSFTNRDWGTPVLFHNDPSGLIFSRSNDDQKYESNTRVEKVSIKNKNIKVSKGGRFIGGTININKNPR